MRSAICLLVAALASTAGVMQAFRPADAPADLSVRGPREHEGASEASGGGAPRALDKVRTTKPVVVQAFRPAGAIAFQGRQRGEDVSEYLPPGAGKALVAKQCSGCHDLRGTIQLRKTREAWEAIVLDMVARGAPVMLEEVDPIIAYLGEAFGSTAPPLVDVNTAPREDLLKLPGVTAAVADRLIEHRTANGALSSREQVRTTLGLDEQSFDKIKWYVQVGKAK